MNSVTHQFCSGNRVKVRWNGNDGLCTVWDSIPRSDHDVAEWRLIRHQLIAKMLPYEAPRFLVVDL
jgi:hypothetical protein